MIVVRQGLGTLLLRHLFCGVSSVLLAMNLHSQR
jgi:hypothetical protein